jgi:hypothetical protein
MGWWLHKEPNRGRTWDWFEKHHNNNKKGLPFLQQNGSSITFVPSPQQCQNPFAGEEGSPHWIDSMAHHPYSHTTTAVV